MKILYIGILVLFISSKLFAQEVKSENNTILKSNYYVLADSLYEEGIKLKDSIPETALSLIEKAYNYAIESNNAFIIQNALYGKAIIYYSLKDYDKTIEYCNKSIDKIIKYDLPNKNDRLVYAYFYKGLAYIDSYRYDLAIESNLEVIKYSELSNNQVYKASALNEIGLVYLRLGRYKEALSNFSKALELKNENNITNGIVKQKLNMAVCYNYLMEYNNSIETYLDLLNSCTNCSDQIYVEIFLGLGAAYISLNEYDLAIENLNKVLALNVEDRSKTSKAYYYLSIIEDRTGNADSAKIYLDRSLEYAEESNDIRGIIANKLQYSKICENEHRYREALKLTQEANVLRDSIYKADLSEKIRDAYVNLANYESDQVISSKNKTIKRNFQFLTMLGIIMVLLMVILAFAYRTLTYRRKLNEKLDIMVQKKTHELLDANRDLIHSRRELDSFLYRTSHDIRGPIATLMGLTSLARLETGDPVIGGYLEKIDQTAGKLNTVISRLTNVSQINSQPLDVKEVNIYQTVEEVIHELKLTPNRIAFKLVTDLPHYVKTDKILLKIILENLLENSFKFRDRTEANPFVELSFIQNGNLEFSITDNGTGIDPQYQDRVFELFFVASERERGTGIGLYQTLLATQKLNGSVVLESNRKPTRFKVSIPLVA